VRRAVALLVLLLLAAGADRAIAAPADVRMMTFNIWLGGDVVDFGSGIAGPPGTPDVTIPIDPYPSDHRAVVSTVRLTPGRAAAVRLRAAPPRHARR